MSVGQRIREAREDLGMPQTVLARRVGVARNTIARYETGEHEPSFAMLGKIARELRTEAHEFFREAAPAPVGAEELDELLDRVGARSRNLTDLDLLRSLEVAGDAAVARCVRETRRELALLVPELRRLGEELEPASPGFMAHNKALSWVSGRVLALDFFLRARDGEQPEEVAVRALSRELFELALAG